MELNAGFDSHDSVSNTTGQITSKQTNKKTITAALMIMKMVK